MSYFLDGFLDELVKLAYAPQRGDTYLPGPEGTRGPLRIGPPTGGAKPVDFSMDAPRPVPGIPLPAATSAPSKIKGGGLAKTRQTARSKGSPYARLPHESQAAWQARVPKVQQDALDFAEKARNAGRRKQVAEEWAKNPQGSLFRKAYPNLNIFGDGEKPWKPRRSETPPISPFNK